MTIPAAIPAMTTMRIKEYEFNKLMDTCDKLSKENETVQQLKQSNEVMKKDLICLNQTLANLQNKFDCMSIESNRLKNIIH